MAGVTSHGIRYPDGASKAKNLGPELQTMAEDIDGYIEEHFDPNDPLFKETAEQAAEQAVESALAESNVVTADLASSEVRTIRPIISMGFQDSAYGVRYPSAYPAIYPDGQWSMPVPRRADLPILGGDGKLSPDVIPAVDPGVLTGLQVRGVVDGPIVLEVRPDGKTYIEGVPVTPGGGSGGVAVQRVVVVAMLGQSNNVAHGQPLVPMFDAVASRVWQLPDGGTTLIPAVVPLTGPTNTATGLSPSHVLAREIAQRDPECVVVLVPAAVGGTGLVTDVESGRGKWEIGYTGPNPRLYANAIAMMGRAFTQISSRWGITPSVVTTWVQGEADGSAGITGLVYQAALDELITDWKLRYGGIFLMAGLVPQASTSGTRSVIVNVQEDAPRRIEHTAFVPGVDNGGGSRGPSDVIHYGREGVEIIGRSWYEAIPRASNNVAGSHTSPPVTVKATKWGSEVTVEWSPPYCLVSEYQVQSSTDGTTWADVPVTKPVATKLTFTSAAPVKVRVRAIGTETSNWTAPVIAIGG